MSLNDSIDVSPGKTKVPKELESIIMKNVDSLRAHEEFIIQTIKNFKFHIHMPYYLSKHADKAFDQQYDFLHRTFPDVWEKLSEDKIKNMIRNIISEVETSYD